MKNLFLFAILLSAVACTENSDITTTTIDTPNSQEVDPHSIKGKVVNIFGESVSNTEVNAVIEGEIIKTTTTDSDGNYRISFKEDLEDRIFIVAENTEYKTRIAASYTTDEEPTNITLEPSQSENPALTDYSVLNSNLVSLKCKVINLHDSDPKIYVRAKHDDQEYVHRPYSSGFTDTNGEIEIFAESGHPFELIYSGQACQDRKFRLKRFSVDNGITEETVHDPVTFNIDFSLVEATGTVRNCDGTLAKGVVFESTSGRHMQNYSKDGNFKISYFNCGGDYDIEYVIHNIGASTFSDKQTASLLSGKNYLGEITTCNPDSSFFNVTINGIDYSLDGHFFRLDSLSETSKDYYIGTSIDGETLSLSMWYSVYGETVRSLSFGEYAYTSAFYLGQTFVYGNIHTALGTNNINFDFPDNIEVYHEGDYVPGSLKGEFNDLRTGETISINGTFNLKMARKTTWQL